MTLFEFVSVMISIILGVSLTQAILTSVAFPARVRAAGFNLHNYFYQVRPWLMAGFRMMPGTFATRR